LGGGGGGGGGGYRITPYLPQPIRITPPLSKSD
jgi:hypothetical protein